MKLRAVSSKIPAFGLIAVCFLLFSCGKKGPPTLRSYEKPAAPSALTAIHRENAIILSWSYGQKENLKGFHIMKSSDNGFERVAFIPKDNRSYVDSDFKTGVIYKYKVIAQSLRDILSDDSNEIEIKPVPVPPAPEGAAFRAVNNSLNITWHSAGEGIIYNVYRSYSKGVYGLSPLNNEPLQTASYSDSLDLNRTVYYTVRSVLNKDSRDESPASGEIEVNPSDFVPSAPEGLHVMAATNERIVLMWNENPEAWVKKYRVYGKTTESGGFRFLGESVTPVFTDKEKTAARHVYRVTAVGPGKESEPSKEISVDF